jgi:Tfp pilus assembly protein PilF
VPVAGECYQAALALNPSDAQLIVDYADFVAQNKLDAQLDTLMDTAFKVLSEDDLAWLADDLGAIWIDARDFDRGVKFMQRVIDLHPKLAMGYNGLAMFQQAQGDAQAALSTVKRGLNDAGDSYFGRYLEVYFTYTTQGVEAALPLAAKLLEHAKVEADAYRLEMQLLDEHGDQAQSAEIGKRGLALFPQDADLLTDYVHLLQKLGDYATAIGLLENPTYSKLEIAGRESLLGGLYLEQGNYVKASALLSTAFQAAPQDAALCAQLGQAQYFMADYKAARESLTRALALDGTNAEAQLWLGFALLDSGDSAGATAAFTALAGTPSLDATIRGWSALGRARVALAGGDKAGALAILSEADKTGDQSPRFRQALAEAQQKAGS